MCVLTYLPLPDGFILTNNRDEHLSRPRAVAPRRYCLHGREVYFPKDPRAGGTWLASTPGRSVCLLNGAFVPHEPRPPYRHSRGQVVLDFFGYASADAFARSYDFTHLEPFTLLAFDAFDGLKISELKWDGERLFRSEKDPAAPGIWSSVTLYAPEVVAAREGWFRAWQRENPKFEAETIWQFHHSAHGDRRNDLVMERPNGLLTFSVMQVEQRTGHLRLAYQDLQTGEEWRYRVL
jgi:hypothetical protein